jgi:hypothetical protein
MYVIARISFGNPIYLNSIDLKCDVWSDNQKHAQVFLTRERAMVELNKLSLHPIATVIPYCYLTERTMDFYKQRCEI